MRVKFAIDLKNYFFKKYQRLVNLIPKANRYSIQNNKPYEFSVSE